MSAPADVAAVIALLTVAVAAVWDLATGRIPNRLSYSALLVGIGLAVWATVAGVDSGGAAALQNAGLGLLWGGLPALLLFGLGSLGGGDVKLLAALGVLLGGSTIVDIWLLAIVLGAAAAAAVVVSQGRVAEVARALSWNLLSLAYPGLQRDLPAQDLKIRFAAPVAIATLLVLLFPVTRPISALFPQLAG